MNSVIFFKKWFPIGSFIKKIVEKIKPLPLRFEPQTSGSISRQLWIVLNFGYSRSRASSNNTRAPNKHRAKIEHFEVLWITHFFTESVQQLAVHKERLGLVGLGHVKNHCVSCTVAGGYYVLQNIAACHRDNSSNHGSSGVCQDSLGRAWLVNLSS